MQNKDLPSSSSSVGNPTYLAVSFFPALFFTPAHATLSSFPPQLLAELTGQRGEGLRRYKGGRRRRQRKTCANLRAGKRGKKSKCGCVALATGKHARTNSARAAPPTMAVGRQRG
jgi:hypothetical protein